MEFNPTAPPNFNAEAARLATTCIRLPFGLDDLTDLFLDRHLFELAVDAIFDFRVEANR